MPKTYCYAEKKITPLDRVSISPYDIGFLRGYGVFDVMRTVNGKPFLLDAHWKRFLRSAKELNLTVPLSKDYYITILDTLLRKNGFTKSTIRTILSGGPSANGFTHIGGNETFVILIEKFKPLPKELYSIGANIITLSYNRHFPIAKITNHVAAIKHQKIRIQKDALEIVFIKNNHVLEASTSNFFIVKNGVILTTKDDILIGTTRNLVLDLAKKYFPVEERAITEAEFRAADEVFLSATNKDIVPVVRIDGKKVSDGSVGPVTKDVMCLFKNFTEQY